MNKINSSTGVKEIVHNAWKKGMIVPGFNIPYLPMMEPVVRALCETNTFGLVMVARLEWIKFKSGSMKAIHQEYEKLKDMYNGYRHHVSVTPGLVGTAFREAITHYLKYEITEI